MLNKLIRTFGGDPNKRKIEEFSEIVNQINALEGEYEALSDADLLAKTHEFKQRLADGETLDDILVEAFAAVREASKRTIGLRHYDVQLIGGIALHRGLIAEMRTGEGKTLVATLPIYLNALTGRGVHLVTVNDYLARRDARWMAPIYSMLGLSVGVLQMASRTENGKKAFLVDLSKSSPHEDQHQLRMVPRAEAYAADITYGTNSEFGFDYLRDNMAMRMEERVQRGHYYAIIDEVDNILIDEARTPLIISGPAQDETEWYLRVTQVVRALRPEDYEINEKDRTVTLTEIGFSHVEELLGMPLRDPDRPEDLTLEQSRILGYLEQALRAHFLFKKNKDYLVQSGKVIIIDEFTGRLMPGRRWSDGLHQAVEAKEGVRVQSESVTYASITIQNYFRLYEKLAGMTGTAATEAEEFDKIYHLGVLVIPTNLEYIAMAPDSPLIELQDIDEEGYRYTYYARKDDPERKPIYWKRKDYPDVIYRTEEAKFRAIVKEILFNHVIGRPVLVGTTSVETSERLASRLRAEPLKRLAQALVLRKVWIEAHQFSDDGRAFPELRFLYEPLEKIDINQIRKLARELEISANPVDETNLGHLLSILNLPEYFRERLMNCLQGGIPNQVLNARKHTEESQIIAGAGSFGAVTIATNMAGRGVDIKLGGELAEEIIAIVNRVLRRSGYADPYDMNLEERRQALLSLDPSAYGIYEAEIAYFLQYMEEMELVRQLGGLHVIGSERHEARRIDNQLRGRSARQGDPGSSRFFLSMEDELMRLFGGQQVDNLMQRMKIDDAFPLEMGLVGRIIEQAQTRVEGANFDVRKHLLEYDDVLNTQRMSIYKQRDRIFFKSDLTEDITELLREEVLKRVPEALQEEKSAWRLFAWLEKIQPSLPVDSRIFPSYSLKIILEELRGKINPSTPIEDWQAAIVNLVRESLEAEKEHLEDVVRAGLSEAEKNYHARLQDIQETIDTYLEGLKYNEENTAPNPSQVINEISTSLRIPLKLEPRQTRMLLEDPEEVSEAIQEQVEQALFQRAILQLEGSISRRLAETVALDRSRLTEPDWELLEELVEEMLEGYFEKRIKDLLGDNGQIFADLQNLFERLNEKSGDEKKEKSLEEKLIYLLLMLPFGKKTVFDRRTHTRKIQQTNRFTYLYKAAHEIEDKPVHAVAEDVLKHLEEARQAVQTSWGMAEFNRLKEARLAELDRELQSDIQNILADDAPPPDDYTLRELPEHQQERITQELGRRAMTQIYRQLLLGVITELWVDYLTQMEALRVSIGLEAYAQRDPLVQYKVRAGELFENLLSMMRQEVVNRMFTYRPRDLSAVQAEIIRLPDEAASPPVSTATEAKPVALQASTSSHEPTDGGVKSKKKRHRHRKR